MDMAWRLQKIARLPSWRCIIFPQSTIKILSVTCFAQQLNDLTGTSINTQKLQSIFYWDSNKFSLTIKHPPFNILEISINEGFTLSTIFCAHVLRVINVSNHPIYDCCFNHMYADYDNEDHCTNKLWEHLKSCHGKSAFATYQNDMISEFLKLAKLYSSQIMDGPGSLRWNIYP